MIVINLWHDLSSPDSTVKQPGVQQEVHEHVED